MSQSFNVFYYTVKSCDECCDSLDTPKLTNTTDAQSDEQCCKECTWFCWPCCITFDIVSCPYRCVKHCVTKHISSKIQKNNEKIIIIQPQLNSQLKQQNA